MSSGNMIVVIFISEHSGLRGHWQQLLVMRNLLGSVPGL
jgi:hypothetical protein